MRARTYARGRSQTPLLSQHDLGLTVLYARMRLMEIENLFQNQYSSGTVSLGARLLHALVEAGYSNTRPRQAVIQAIVNAGSCFSPHEILKRGQLWHARLGLTTVYRTLELLLSLGLVHRVHQEEGCHSYALSEKAHEQQLICARCHQRVSFEGCDLSNVLMAVSKETGYRIRGHRLEIFGVCPACQDKSSHLLEGR